MDTRIANLMGKKDLPGNVAKKVRVLGEASKSNPPYDAPTWAVSKEHISVEPDQGVSLFFILAFLLTNHLIYAEPAEPVFEEYAA